MLSLFLTFLLVITGLVLGQQTSVTSSSTASPGKACHHESSGELKGFPVPVKEELKPGLAFGRIYFICGPDPPNGVEVSLCDSENSLSFSMNRNKYLYIDVNRSGPLTVSAFVNGTVYCPSAPPDKKNQTTPQIQRIRRNLAPELTLVDSLVDRPNLEAVRTLRAPRDLGNSRTRRSLIGQIILQRLGLSQNPAGPEALQFGHDQQVEIVQGYPAIVDQRALRVRRDLDTKPQIAGRLLAAKRALWARLAKNPK